MRQSRKQWRYIFIHPVLTIVKHTYLMSLANIFSIVILLITSSYLALTPNYVYKKVISHTHVPSHSTLHKGPRKFVLVLWDSVAFSWWIGSSNHTWWGSLPFVTKFSYECYSVMLIYDSLQSSSQVCLYALFEAGCLQLIY